MSEQPEKSEEVAPAATPAVEMETPAPATDPAPASEVKLVSVVSDNVEQTAVDVEADEEQTAVDIKGELGAPLVAAKTVDHMVHEETDNMAGWIRASSIFNSVLSLALCLNIINITRIGYHGEEYANSTATVEIYTDSAELRDGAISQTLVSTCYPP